MWVHHDFNSNNIRLKMSNFILEICTEGAITIRRFIGVGYCSTFWCFPFTFSQIVPFLFSFFYLIWPYAWFRLNKAKIKLSKQGVPFIPYLFMVMSFYIKQKRGSYREARYHGTLIWKFERSLPHVAHVWRKNRCFWNLNWRLPRCKQIPWVRYDSI